MTTESLDSFSGNYRIDDLIHEDSTTGSAAPDYIWTPGLGSGGTTPLTYSIPANTTELGHISDDWDSRYNITNQYGAPGTHTFAASTQHAALFVEALNEWQEFSGLRFSSVTESSTVHGDITMFDFDGERTAGTWLPGQTGTGQDGTIDWRYGSSGLSNLASPKDGDYEVQTIIHEVGHAIGLEHPFNGYDTLPSSDDFLANTDMTYTAHPGEFDTGSFDIADGDYPSTPMGYDILAAQWLYGANYGSLANNTNSVYTWASNGAMSINGTVQNGGATDGGNIFEAVWDGGGVDTYDFSNFTTTTTLDLRPGHWVNLGTQVADLSQTFASYESPGTYMAPGNIFNAYQDPNNPTETASLIEKVIGGSGADVIYMNDAGDTATGGAGNDTIWGGAGTDTAIFSHARSAYTENYGTTGWDHQTDTTGGGGDGVDWVQNNIEWFKYSDGTYSYAHVAAGDVLSNPMIANISATHDTRVSLAPLVSIDGYGSPTKYQFWSNDAANGHLVMGGVLQDYGVDEDLSLTDMATATIDIGHGSSPVTDYLRAFNGTAWSGWTSFTVTATANTAPTVSTTAMSAGPIGTHYALSSIFSASDADSDSIKEWQVYFGDGTTTHGHPYMYGAEQAHNTGVYMTPDQFAHTDLDNTTDGTMVVYAKAFDGVSWSAGSAWTTGVTMPTATTVTPDAHAPTTSYTGATLTAGVGTDNLGANITATYADGDSDPAKVYLMWDDNNGYGHATVAGVAMGTNQNIELTPTQMSTLAFQGTAVGTEHLYVKAFDGTQWGSWTTINETVSTEHDPVVAASGASTNLAVNSSTALSSLISVSDADGSGTIASYEVWMGSTADGSAYLTVGGIAQHQGSWDYFTASQLSSVDVIGASTAGVTETMYVNAFDQMGHQQASALALSMNSH